MYSTVLITFMMLLPFQCFLGVLQTENTPDQQGKFSKKVDEQQQNLLTKTTGSSLE